MTPACTRAASIREPFVDLLLREYLPILILLAIATGLGLVLILAAAVLAVRNPDPEKVSEDGLREAGAFGVVAQGFAVQVVVGPVADELVEEIKALR